MKESETLGRLLEKAQAASASFRRLMYVALAALVVLNLFIVSHHPHFPGEEIPGFWAAFGLIFAVVMSFVLKKIIFPFIHRTEESYD
ncbi:hypothetical protein G3N56_00835 [Desulfovibrio sulfodismutans]|uniref:2TM domain-containing protein n=1 Tax=Desulfolutivibrio sulfodismutans TaxID=63561 RepID=A0A7K3NGH7_9BACT|nr:hypothetical protein [Desulfolutivibrio sulfodismutans]NDY55291.1 hypothetical protein [Desulfolutivibrio sulfodismutans]QLA12674.1 hypothetical protein GD606_10515 [Desulfolutivibrio sulfodismutans DSM 3696]